MAIKAQYTTRKTRKKDGSIQETKYRIDPTFVPEKIGDICDEFIVNYCVANGKEEWLYNELNKTETAKANKDRKVKAVVDGVKKTIEVKAGEEYQQQQSFVSLRSAFANEFFSDIIKGQSVKESAFDKFLKEYKK